MKEPNMNKREFSLTALGSTVEFLTLMNSGLIRANAQSSTWSPTKPLKLIVSAAPGSPPDVTARPLAEQMSSLLGQPVLIENRPGAGGIVGMETLIRSQPDGHTLGLASQSQMVFNQHLFEKLPYDPNRDVQPLIRLASVAVVLVAHPSLPVDSLRELAAYSRTKPNPLQVAVAPLGQPPHVLGLLAQSEANLRLDWLPFKGGVEAVAACRAGEIPLAIEAPSTVAQHIKAGTLKAIAVTGIMREPTLPDVPTFSEILGRRIPGDTWFGLILPKGTSAEIVSRLQREASAALAKTEMRSIYSRFGWRVIDGSSPEEFASTIAEEGPRWAEIIRKAGLKLG
jgi:tripartite-type tricarboxylate transporter receptor subunit TctC